MDTKEFTNKVKRLHAMQTATIKFNKQDGMVGLMRLKALVDHNENLGFAYGDEIVVIAVIQSHDWGVDRNRTVTVWGLSQGDEAMLMEIARDVESLEHPDHPAKGITAKRGKSRQKSLDELRDAIIPACVQEAEEWGLDLDFDITDDDGFVVAWFRVKHEDTVHQSIGVDGWSGRLLQKNGLPECRYTHPEQVQALLGEAISDVADQLTAA